MSCCYDFCLELFVMSCCYDFCLEFLAFVAGCAFGVAGWPRGKAIPN